MGTPKIAGVKPGPWLNAVARRLGACRDLREERAKDPRADADGLDAMAFENAGHILVQRDHGGATTMSASHQPPSEPGHERDTADFTEGDGDFRINIHRPMHVA